MEKFNFTNGSNVTFHQGYIEDLKDIGTSTVDVVVSNCVVNLSPRKDLVMKEIFRVLKDGGEFYFSDVFVDRRLPSDIAFDPLLHSECLGGALYVRDFVTLAKKTGFKDPRVLTTAPITIQNDEIEAKCGMARFTSITYRLFKIDSLDSFCEDYGQTATYLGSIDSSPSLFVLDDKHSFEVQRPERVCANTALMLSKTRQVHNWEKKDPRWSRSYFMKKLIFLTGTKSISRLWATHRFITVLLIVVKLWQPSNMRLKMLLLIVDAAKTRLKNSR